MSRATHAEFAAYWSPARGARDLDDTRDVAPTDHSGRW
jgi:hypothetical protein